MKLSSFRIKKFKSIIDTGYCHLSETDNITVMAGQNEAGKTAVIEALDFFRNGPSAKFEKLQKRKDEDPEVECVFILSAEDIKNVFIESENEELRKELERDPHLGFISVKNETGNFDELAFNEETERRLAPFFETEEEEEQEEELKTNPETGEAPVEGENPEQTQEAQEEPEEEENEEGGEYNSEDLLEFLVNEMRTFVFYDSFNDLLPGLITIKEIPTNAAVQDFQKVFNVDFAAIVAKESRGIARDELDLTKRASDDLNKYWTQKLEKNSKYNFRVKIIKKEPVEESTVEFMIDREDGDPLFLEQKSNGFRWFSSFNMRLRALGVKQTTVENLVILIDEPGQGLHEKAQKDLKQVLEELAGKGAQVIYTTHYPNLIGTVGNEFARIRLISNTTENGTKAETVAQFASRADVGASDALSPIITAMGIQSVGGLLDRDRYNVVVEGITDHYYLSAFAKILNKNPLISFIPACGVSNVPNIVSLLVGWGINYKAVLDDDAGSGRKAYNLLKKEFYENDDIKAHEHILKIRGCNGIEDVFSPNDFYDLVLGETIPTGTLPQNSVSVAGRKEMLARLFLEKVDGGGVVLDATTQAKVEEVFNWLEQKFGI